MCERGWRLISHHLPKKHVEEQDTTGEKDPFPKVLQSGRWSCRRSLQGLMEVKGEILAFEEVEGLCSRLEGYANPKNELLFAPFWSCQKACELITSSAALLLCSQLLLWTTENFHLLLWREGAVLYSCSRVTTLLLQRYNTVSVVTLGQEVCLRITR